MRNVYDYKDLRRLEESTIYERLRSGAIITATADLATEIGNYYPGSEQKEGITAIDVHRVIGSMVEVWDKKVKDIRNFVYLRNIIEEYIVANDLSDIHKAYLRRNAADIWNAIVLLVEADVYPDDIPENVAPPVKDFKRLWNQIEMENPAFMQFRSSFLFNLSDKEYLEQHLPRQIREKELFFLGFYFITPIQARLIDALENAGYKINYLNGYDGNHPFVFEIWQKTFAEEYLAGSTVEIQPDINIDNCFVSCIEKKSEYPDFLKIDYFKNDIDFATACMTAKKNGASMYTTDSKRTDNLLREFFPEEYDNRHLLSYPVGQYIYYLHMIWNEFLEEPELRFEYVFKCFATGWLEDDGINGKDYLYELKILEPFFKGCNAPGKKSFAEWKNRAEQLLEAKKATEVFGGVDNDRWEHLLGNPFKNMAIYNVSEAAIESIKQLIDRLIADAELLFNGALTKNLYSHMQNIKQVIESHADKDDVTDDEQFVVKELLDRLGGTASEGVVCHLNGIKDAILLLIGDHHDNEESHEDETSDKKRMVKPLSVIEASVLCNYGEDIYLVMTDEFLLPGKPRKLPWPLSTSLVNEMTGLLTKTRPDTVPYVRAMVNLIDTRPLANRYLFYSLFDNVQGTNKPQIHLSWIMKQGDKDVAASPYIPLLGWNEPEDLKQNEIEWTEKLSETIKIQLAIDEKVPKVSIHEPSSNVPQEVLSDYALCKMRYAYSYLLNEIPSYSSEFHYSFVLSNIVSAISSISGQDKNVISKQIYELFPFLRMVEKQQATDYAYTYKSDDYEYKGTYYPGNRLDVHYLQSFIKGDAEQKAMTLFETGSVKWEINSEYCKYCPYTNICRVKFEGVDKYES